MYSERTPLRSGPDVPPYVFVQGYNRSYRKRIRKFQCCLCAGLMAMLITTLVITISYAMNHFNQADNSTEISGDVTNDTDTKLLTLSYPIEDQKYTNWESTPNQTIINLAIEHGFKELKMRQKYEETAPTLIKDSPSFRHQLTMKTSPKARKLAEVGYVLDRAATYLVGEGGNIREPCRLPLLRNDDWLSVCHNTIVNCTSSPYRTADGSCNNLKHSNWGVAFNPFRRIIPADYADGISSPRMGVDGSLPSAREVSLCIHRPIYRDDPNFTVMLAVWGQFIDHDMTATALSQSSSGQAISCCYNYIQAGIKSHPECLPVVVSRPDPYFEQYNVSCLDFVRSAPSPSCSLGPREQMNQVSSFVDGSAIYGPTDELMNQLRTFENGQLKTLTTPDGQELLPVSTDPNDGCNQQAELANGRYCFLTGDARSNENIHLTTLHLLFVRQHNKIAHELAAINPHWNDEVLFQESRKIVAAELEHITYNEFLPIVLGNKAMEKLQNPKYNSSVNPTIANSFAASAFRFGHTLLPGLIKMIQNATNSEEYIALHKMLFNPFKLYDREFLESAVRGAMNFSVEKVDTYFNKEITNHLFEKDNETKLGICGLDLVSLNIQRGRDHGLPGYPKWREHCGLKKPKTFDDLQNYVDPESLHRMKQIYKHVDDIDMYTGLLAEAPIPGSLTGPTLNCLLTDQFIRLQQGDRFWFETTEKPQAYSAEQLASIKKVTLARVICDTSEIEKAQPLVMRKARDTNPLTLCTDLPELDLKPWKTMMPRVNVGHQLKISAKTEDMPVKATGFVSGGSVALFGTTVWLGNRLPLTLPVMKQNADDIRWQGFIRNTTPGVIRFWGGFAIRQPLNGSYWYNGDFAFSITLTNMLNSTIDMFGTYSTNITYFENDLNQEIAKDWVLDENNNLSSSPQITNGVFKTSHIILFGSYTEDRKQFIWSGNVTVICQ